MLHEYLDLQDRFFEDRNGRHELVREYKRRGWLPKPEYDKLAAEFDALIVVVDFYAAELTRAANDLCEAVRETVHRSFRRVDGHLLVTSGPYGFFEYRTNLYVYTDGRREYAGRDELLRKLGPEMSQRLAMAD
ncbi:MAG: hypothetical protein DI536_35340 [Archangium gephyra]|uniref:Uncharacterized protein n=1 Tax=Archangium gephyra TaxID=48 RepID=A0A2W5UKM2_9BACT|nr:MAG: hypothetical protein DI536_35340 [Archangium gephyra]